MKSLHLTFDDKEMEKLRKRKEKENKTWHDFILMLVDWYCKAEQSQAKLSGAKHSEADHSIAKHIIA